MAQEIMDKDEAVIEKKYTDACKLQEATDCVVRFERKAKTLRSAAKKFHALGDYKDASERAKECEHAAVCAEQEGMDEVYASAREIENEAKTKHDYISAIEQYRRLKKRVDFEEKIKPRIQECKRKIGQIENKAAWKRRVSVLVVLVLMVLLFMQTSLYPFAKGYFHRSRGQYDAAIADFKAATGLPWQEGQLHKTYYCKGKAYLEDGRKDKAMHYLRLARTSKEAQKELLPLELDEIRSAGPGDTVKFGTVQWLVLDIDTAMNAAVMIALGEGYDCQYDTGDAKEWQDTTIYHWLNRTFRDKVFSDVEKHAIYKEYHTKAPDKKSAGEVVLLNFDLYTEYQSLLRENIPELASENWWLEEETDSEGIACFIDTSGELQATRVDAADCKARPVIRVNISKS